MAHHDHPVCSHELAYCGQCKVVHCRKCHKEWGEGAPMVAPAIPSYPVPWAGYPIWTWTTSGTSDPLPATVTTYC